MREIHLGVADATLSDVVDEAVRGEGAVIMRHGKPQAIVLGYASWQRLNCVPSFARLLMSAPDCIEELSARDETLLR